MELTQLRYFYCVYRGRSIRSASSELNVTQQAISRQIKNLEEELGVELFERKNSGVEPTEYGHMMADRVGKILTELDSFVYSVQKRDQIISGVVRLGVQCWQMSEGGHLPYEVLKDFQAEYPQIHLVWENRSPAGCHQGLRDNELDLAVACMPNQVELYELTKLRSFQWYMLMSRSHPLAQKKKLTLEDFSGQNVIFPGEEVGSRSDILRSLHGMSQPRFIDVKDYIFDLLGQEVLGNQALMLTLTAQLGLFNPEKFVMIPVEGNPWRNQLYLCSRAGNVLTPAAEALWNYLKCRWTRE